MLDKTSQLGYYWDYGDCKMPKQRITKTLSLDQAVVQTIEKTAKQERRSFTQQVELMLENALARQKSDNAVKPQQKTA